MKNWCHPFKLAGVAGLVSLVACTGLDRSALAQITPDGTLGTETSIVTPNMLIDRGMVDRIDGGAIRGGNLFHSFTDFNVLRGQQVYFANPNAISNIISRVTGRNLSSIDGMLGVLGTANLFLINPNGIVFGPNARLDVRGSFVASTADRVAFGQGYNFSATNPDTPPLLTVNAPLGLSSWLPTSGTVTSSGNLTAGQDLALVGANLDLRGQLRAGSNLTLVASNTLVARDSSIAPFVAAAGQRLLLQGNQTIDIFALNHPGSGLFSGGDMVLRSNGSVIGDAHYQVGGNFAVERLNGSIGNLMSVDDPIVLAVGDVRIGDYVGASLHILAGGSVELGNVTITGVGLVATTINPANLNLIPGTTTPFSALSPVTLSDGTLYVVNGNLQPTLDVRAGVNWSRSPFTGAPGIAAPTDLPGGSVTFLPPAGTGSSITVGDVAMAAPGGLVLLTNQYQPNTAIPAGQIRVSSITDQFAPFDPGSNIAIDARSDIVLPFPSAISSVGAPGGNISLLSQTAINQVAGAGGSSFIESVSFAGNGGTLTLAAPRIFLGGDAVTLFLGAIDTGRGGDVRIRATSFETDFSTVGAATFGYGNGGDVFINSDSILLNEAVLVTTVLFDPTAPGGNAGNLTLTTRTLTATEGGQVGSFTNGIGNAGNVTINADTIRLDGFRVGFETGQPVVTVSGIGSAVNQGAVGSGGNIAITTRQLSILNGAQIRTSSEGVGNAGQINVRATNISLDGAVFVPEVQGQSPTLKPTFPSGILSEVRPTAVGRGGEINLFTSTLSVTNGGRISANTQAGDAGNINITATRSAIFDGVASFAAVGEENRISSASVETLELATGQGGTFTITTPSLAVINGAQITAETRGVGNAGSLRFNISDSLLLSGIDSGLIASTTPTSTGNGGSIEVDPDIVRIQNGARIAVASRGTGTAGNITVRANSLVLSNNGLISAETVSNTGGNIFLSIRDVLAMRNNSRISTSAGTAGAGGDGGRIAIDAGFLVTVPTENNDITANAFAGRGGSVDITAQGIFGFQVLSRFQLVSLLGTNDPTRLDPIFLPSSDITAISQTNPNLDGVVTIRSPDVDPSRGAVALPSAIVDASRLIARDCSAGGTLARNLGSLTVTGRGGLPPSPSDQLQGDSLLIGWETAGSSPRDRPSASVAPPPAPVQLVEVQTLQRLPDGRVVLVAQKPAAATQDFWSQPASCPTLP